MNVTPTPLTTGTLTTTNNTKTLVTGFNISSYTSVSGGCLITVTASAIATSGLSSGAVGAARANRLFKYNASSNTVTALTDLIVVGSIGGVVVANVAPLVGDIAMNFCNVTLDPDVSGIVNFYVTGLSSANVDWTISADCFIP